MNTKESAENCVAKLSPSVTHDGNPPVRRVQTHPAGRAPISHCGAQLVPEIRARVPGALINIVVKSLHLASCWHSSKDNHIPHSPCGLPLPRGCYKLCHPPR